MSRLRWLAAPVSWAYALTMRIRNLFYDTGIFRQHRVDVPVISVGNIVLGGSGKTPVTIAIAEALSEKKVAILIRGYRSAAEHGPPTLVDENDWRKFGDEACLIAKRLPDAIVIVGKDRVAGAQFAIAQGAQVIILDDGMQHRRLARDLNLVIVNDDEKHVFPWGNLREPLSGLKRADRILKYGVDIHYVSESDLTGKHVGIFCGIAKPERFQKTVESLGATVVHHKFLRDHASMDHVEEFIQQCFDRGAEKVLCTEKDWIKLSNPQDVECVRISAIVKDLSLL